MTLEGALDGDAFAAYLREFLIPTLVPGQIIVMDNLSVHKDKRVRPLIAGAGCLLIYLPAYSPDLTPIEQAFSKIKDSGVAEGRKGTKGRIHARGIDRAGCRFRFTPNDDSMLVERRAGLSGSPRQTEEGPTGCESWWCPNSCHWMV